MRGDHSQCFVEFVDDRSLETLVGVIRRKIKPGTMIVSDCWSGYGNLPAILPDMHFQHLTVNHSVNYVNPENRDAHTQKYWGILVCFEEKIEEKRD